MLVDPAGLVVFKLRARKTMTIRMPANTIIREDASFIFMEGRSKQVSRRVAPAVLLFPHYFQRPIEDQRTHWKNIYNSGETGRHSKAR